MKKDDNNDSLLTKLSYSGAAVGASAYLLYKTINGKNLSEFISKSSKSLKELTNDLYKKSRKDMDYDFIHNEIKKRFLDEDSTFNTTNNDIFINNEEDSISALSQALRLKNNPRQELRKLYDTNRLEEVKNELSDIYGNKDEDSIYQIRNFVDDVINNFNEVTEGVKNVEDNRIELNQKTIKRTLDNSNIDEEFNDEVVENMFTKVLDAKKQADEDLRKALSTHNDKFIDESYNKLLDIDSLKKQFGSQDDDNNFFKNVLDQHATWNDVVQNRDKIKNKKIFINGPEEIEDLDLIDNMEKLIKKNPEYGKIYASPNIRKNKANEIYSIENIRKIGNAVLDEAANTIPGKIFKVRDALQYKQQPFYRMWTKGEYDAVIGTYDKNNRLSGNFNGLLQDNYVKFYNKVYKVNSDHSFSYIPELDDLYLISGKHGSQSYLLKEIMGSTDRVIKKQNKFNNFFGLFETPSANIVETSLSKITKFKDDKWIRNIVDNLFSIDSITAIKNLSEKPISEQDLKDKKNFTFTFLNNLKDLNKWMSTNSMPLSSKTISKIMPYSKNKDLLKTLLVDNNELIKDLITKEKTNFNFQNNDLHSMIMKYINNPRAAYDTLSISKDKSIFGGTRALDFYDLLRKEVGKEFFLQETLSNKGERSSINRLFDRANIKGMERNKSIFLANNAILQKVGNLYNRGISQADKLPNVEQIKNIASNTYKLLFSEDKYYEGEFYKEFRDNIKRMSKEYSSLLEQGDTTSNKQIIKGPSYGQWTSIRKPVLVKDIISSLNNNIKDTSTLKKWGKQWFAGRNNPEDITTATLFPYFTLNRLIDPLSSIGLNFPSRFKGSTVDLAKNMFLKRILPITVGVTYLSYFNDLSRNLTGNSLYGGILQTKANINLGFHRFTDTLGITNSLISDRRSNVISQYLFGDQPYRTTEEQKDYYETGYTPVRQGRWWSFGSSSEFKGGKIEYFQPNSLIMTRKNWYNNSVYGSSFNKWSHSWIPNPSMPISPLIRLLDPYYLDRLHKQDRPYPVSGPMFSTYTPWGGVLNGTIGQVLKPQIRMHTNELGNSLVDVRTLIAQRNQAIKNKGNNNQLVRFDSNFNIEPISFTPLNNNDSKYTANFNIQGSNNKYYMQGNLQSNQYSTIDMNEYKKYYTNKSKGVVVINNSNNKFSNVIDSVNIDIGDKQSFIGGLFRGVFSNNNLNSSKSIISSINTSIKNKNPKGIVITDPVFTSTANKRADLLYNKEAMADIKNTSPQELALQDDLYSAKEILGIYGFLFDSLTNTNTKQKNRLADSSDINSFANRFWNQSIGGNGGEFMEIARRFFPHQSHDINRINPIRNIMPDWMPDYFKTGDPYTKVSNGEFRLPGKGYLSMYKLHPDLYGPYGAYDRMKILADVAPWSQEYKLWRQIASQTVTNPILQKQMVNIKDRVERQSKQHDFYPYMFIGSNKVNINNSVVSTVLSNGKFTTVGDNRVYKVAGVNIRGNTLNNYLKPGEPIVLKTNKNVNYKYDQNNNTVISAAVIANGVNIGNDIIKNNLSQENTEDNTPAAIQSRFNDFDIMKGSVFELIGHAPIPFIHNKFMRIDSPLESWKRHQIYGSSFSTWQHPIKGFIMPSLNTQWSYGPLIQSLSLLSFIGAKKIEQSNAPKLARYVTKIAQWTINPSSFIGFSTGFALRTDKKFGNIGEHIGVGLGLLGYGIQHLNNPIESTMNFGVAGYLLAKQLKLDSSKYAPEILKKTPKEFALIGAVTGLALSSVKNSRFDKNSMFSPFIPKDKKKVWETQEYYDRLKYIKYMGLYKKASRQAFLKEGVDVNGLVSLVDKRKKEYDKRQKELLVLQNRVSNIYPEGDFRKKAYMDKLQNEMSALQTPQFIVRAGEYTKSAIAYKYAAESTIYGLKNNATWSQILRSLPKKDRDYFMEFAKERDKNKRKEILKYVSPYEQKVLHIAWGDKVKEPISNNKFFKNHFLPGTFWAGWRPDTNLDDVEIKEIKNEGEILSEYGFYDSNANSPNVQVAPIIHMQQDQSSLTMKKNLITSLKGAGLIGVDVSITPSSKPGIQMVANIIRIKKYEMQEKINNAFN